MTTDGDKLKRDFDFRKQAKDGLSDRDATIDVPTSPTEIAQLIHELQVHQIELQTQNEELRRTQSELDASRARYVDLYDFAPVGYMTLSEEGLIVEANLTMATLLGIARSYLLKQPISRYILHSDQDIFYHFRKQLIQSRTPSMCELQMHNEDAPSFWVRMDGSVSENDGRLQVAVSNISTNKEASQKLLRERQRLNSILYGTNVGTWEWNIQTNEAIFNERWAELIGYKLDELAPTTNQTWEEVAHPEDLERSKALLKRHFAGELAQYECEVRMRHRAGHWVWVLTRGRVLTWTSDGQPEWMFGTHQDITDRKEAEQKLAASEAFLTRTGRLAKVGGWQLELASEHLSWTKEAQQICGFPMDARPDKASIVACFSPEAQAAITQSVRMVTKKGGSFDLELPFTTVAGQTIWMRILGGAEFAGRDQQGRPSYVSGAIQDVTSLRAASDALREATRAAELANKAKSEFLANMSHEIRTPLNAILGANYLLEHSHLDSEQRRFVTTIQVAGQGLLGIVNDVLDLAKIEAGNISINAVPFELNGLVEELVALFESQAKEKNLVFEWQVPPEVPLVNGDYTRLRQILINLLGNAIKFTQQGSVRLEVTVKENLGSQLRVRFTVYDTGIGISEEAKTHIFTPFKQADTSTTRRFGGTGLGLSIVRHLGELMGGETGVDSQLGIGSAFWVEIPLIVCAIVDVSDYQKEPTTLNATSTEQRLVGTRVLVVDDCGINREIVSYILSKEGATVTISEDGKDALAFLRTNPNDFDLVLMDIQMPNMDGNETTARIRGELGLTNLPVVALTAGALASERHRSIAAGMSDFISKPLNPERLVALISRHISDNRNLKQQVAAFQD
jgi:PAS domain S-box-containing protein